jgi:hypothetical protein
MKMRSMASTDILFDQKKEALRAPAGAPGRSPRPPGVCPPSAGRVWLPGLALLLACSSLVLGPNPARADMITYVASGQNHDMEPLNATAEFTTGAGSLSLTLTNLVNGAAVRSAGQEISGIAFTLSTTPGGASGAGASGQLINVGPGGTVTAAGGNPDRWLGPGHITTSGSTIQLLVLGGGRPSEMILGLPGADGRYDNANASILNFNPSVEGSATFDLNAAGVTSGTTVTGATLFFGTGPDTSLVASPAPEPSGLALSAVGLATVGAAGLLRWRRRPQLGW